MATTDKYLTHRGDLKAVAAAGQAVLFVTAHPEGRSTALYRLNVEKLTLDADPLVAGAVDVATDGQTVWVAGTDGRIHRGAVGGGLVPLKADFQAPPTKVALSSDGRLAVLAGSRVHVLSAKDGKPAQSPLELPEPGSVLAVDPSGNWLLVGTTAGTVSVFAAEGRDEFLLSEQAKLHEGAVTALLFEPDDLRFLSAGTDGKLLSTHARGTLEPEDKGRGNNHAEAVTGLAWVPGDRFVSGGRDATLKSWPRVGGVKPATTKDGLAKVVGLCVAQVGTRTHLVVACEDNTLRVFPVDTAGKVGDLAARLHGAAAWAKNELSDNDVKAREAALRTLATWDDLAAVEAIAAQIQSDGDHGLRLLATQLLAGSAHPRAATLLEKPLRHADEVVRVAAFAGLRKLRGEADLHPLNLALNAEKADVGRLAVAALQKLAATDDQALAKLTRTLDNNPPEVRRAALEALEAIHGDKSPEASILATASKHADLRRVALVRLLQRGLLADPRVGQVLRRATEDADADVRRSAFLLSLHTRDRLVAALRARSPELERQLAELESTEGAEVPPAKAAATAKAPKPASKSKKSVATGSETGLEESDFDPLLQATASRSLDTCLRGAGALAALGDERALGLLLQLSREKEASARVDVARALAALDDPRAAGRLRSLMFDDDAAVRDAAFTALAKLDATAEGPLAAAEAAFGAAHDDVRHRGLEAVIAVARKRLPQSAADPAWPLFIRALNDNAAAVRTEAFKAALNLQIGGGGPNTLRFVLQSVHADVRREALTEVMAQIPSTSSTAVPAGKPTDSSPWAWALLLEFLDDPDPKLRGEAFDFAMSKVKDLSALEAALAARHPDVRRRAATGLAAKHTKAALALLSKAVADDDPATRQTAVDALVGDDARDALRAALNSPHDDVHARAAVALARHGDPAARPALVDLAAAPEPVGQSTARVNAWTTLTAASLEGLAALGDPDTLPHVQRLLDSHVDRVCHAAAAALPWVAVATHPGALRQAMQHADPQVGYHAALGLALGGEASAAPLVFGPGGTKVLSAAHRLAAAIALGPAGEDQLVAFLDGDDEQTRAHALILLMLLELKSADGVPSRCLAALASRDPRVRLRAARGLDTFRDPKLFLQFVTGLFADRRLAARDDEKPWDVPPAAVDAIADLVARGGPAVRARTVLLLGELFGKSQAGWDRARATHEARFAAELAAARSAGFQPVPSSTSKGPAAPPAGRHSAAQLDELAFGAYVGLAREQGGSAANVDAAAVARVRQTALTWLLEMAKRDPARARAARSVFTQSLRDPAQSVRMQAFDQLRTTGADPTALGADALESGHVDLGVRGLELLSGTGGGTSSAAGAAVLEQAMLARTDDLAVEASNLLAKVRPPAAVAAAALNAAHPPLRQHAVVLLASLYDQSPEAAEQLRSALKSRHLKVREAAAYALADKKDPAAFDALAAMLAAAEKEPQQGPVVTALSRLGDPRTPAALLDRLTNDPARTGAAGLLISSAAAFRDPAVAPRLLDLMEREPSWRLHVGNAVRTISGYDQVIPDPNETREDDPKPDRSKLKQYPRHDAVLAALMERSLVVHSIDRLTKLIPSARWAPGKDVDPILARLAAHPEPALRQAAVEAVGWRARKRGGSVEPLRAALAHRDPVTQFVAAEGLARAGRADGLSVLLSSLDLLPDVNLRRRAVEALGVLGDGRALDALLKIAAEDGHILQDAAAEALGRLGKSPGATDEVFKLLRRLATSGRASSAEALKGLRWVDTPAAWEVIRERASAAGGDDREAALKLLRHDPSPAVRDLLLKVIATADDMDVATAAFASARTMLGEGSLDVHYAWLQNPLAEDAEDGESIELLGKGGDAGRVFEMLPRVAGDNHGKLATALLARDPLPVAESAAALGGSEPRTVAVAARVLGRAGPDGLAGLKGAAKSVGPTLSAAIEKWTAAWAAARDRIGADDEDDEDGPTEAPAATIRALLWAAGRLRVAAEALSAAVAARPGDPRYAPIRLEAASALAEGELKAAASMALESAAVGDDPAVRALAVDALATRSPKRAAELAERILPDRVSFNRLAADVGEPGIRAALRSAAGQGHYQGVALPHLVAAGDVAALSAVAADRALPEVTRLGAIEGLGRLTTDDAAAKLKAIGGDAKEDEAVRKAAWKSLRRAKRARVAAVGT